MGETTGPQLPPGRAGMDLDRRPDTRASQRSCGETQRGWCGRRNRASTDRRFLPRHPTPVPSLCWQPRRSERSYRVSGRPSRTGGGYPGAKLFSSLLLPLRLAGTDHSGRSALVRGDAEGGGTLRVHRQTLCYSSPTPVASLCWHAAGARRVSGRWSRIGGGTPVPNLPPHSCCPSGARGQITRASPAGRQRRPVWRSGCVPHRARPLSPDPRLQLRRRQRRLSTSARDHHSRSD